MIDFDLNEPVIEEDEDAPFVGQTFQTREEALIFYNNYAKNHGFVIVTDRTDTTQSVVVVLVLRITLKQSFDIFPQEWHVTVLVKQHNHPMLSHEELRREKHFII